VTNHSKKGKNKDKGKGTNKTKQRKNMQKTRYVFNRDILSKDVYLNYFRPADEETEKRMLGVLEMVCNSLLYRSELNINVSRFIQAELNKAARRPQANSNLSAETHTQGESQDVDTSSLKRPAPWSENDAPDTSRPKKKVKMSLAVGVDLAE